MMPSRWWIPNPLRLRGTTLPEPLVLIARFLVLVLILLRDWPVPRHLPYFRWLDSLGSAAQFHWVLTRAAAVGYLLVLFSPFIRLGCLLVGAAFLTGLLGCRPSLSVAHTYVACVCLILAMSSRASGSWLLRGQVVIVYFGATLNKALDGDWWSGRYFETFMIERHQHELYIQIASYLPPLALSQMMGAATILTQFFLAVCFLWPRWYGLGVLLGVVFHSVMVLMMNESFGPFYLAILISYLAFVAWPDRIQIALGAPRWHQWLKRVLSVLDSDRMYHFSTLPVDGVDQRQGLEVGVNDTRQRGLVAVSMLLFFNPIMYLAAAILLTRNNFSGLLRSLAIVLLVIYVVSLLAVGSRAAAICHVKD